MLLCISYLHEQLQGELFERREGRESYRIHQEGCFLGFMGRPIKYDADWNEHEWWAVFVQFRQWQTWPGFIDKSHEAGADWGLEVKDTVSRGLGTAGTPFFKSGISYKFLDNVSLDFSLSFKFVDMITSAVYLNECILKTGVKVYFWWKEKF